MNLAGLSAVAACLLLQLSGITGQVTGPDGTPVHGARVFAEPGIAGALLETQTAEDGQFRIDNVAGEGVGVFAIAPGLGFGGRHVNLSASAEAAVPIQLQPAASISGSVATEKGEPIRNARITRVGILSEPKVGIPLAKLGAFGFPEPVTNEKGEYTIANLPAGAKIAIKIAHSDYAQEALDNVDVGRTDLRAVLHPGVTLRGEVTARQGGQPLSSVSVLVRSAQPPHDTAMVLTDASGQFSLRLKPGQYACQASGASLRSAGWEAIAFTDEAPEAMIRLSVAATGSIHGEMRDAVSGKPVEGARILVECGGKQAALLRTGSAGEFQTALAEGEALIKLEPVPGYAAPERAAIRVQVAAGQNVELPGLWLKPIPMYRLQVVDEDAQRPVSGAVITLLNPPQLGWHVTGPDGSVELGIAAAPAGGRIVGFVEDRTRPLGALFQIAATGHAVARVQLLPLASITGRVVSEGGKPAEGIAVSAVFEDIELWRTVSGADGVFSWPSVVPGVPQQCLVHAAAPVQSKGFNPQFGASENLGDIVIGASPKGASFLGKRLPWRKYRLLQGPAPARDGPAIVVYASREQVPALLESLSAVQGALGDLIMMALVSDDGVNVEPPGIPVFSGKAPALATTYVVGDGGKVVLETFGLPPLRALTQEAR